MNSLNTDPGLPNDYNRLIFALKDKFDLDFSNYAKSSFQRRVERLLTLRNIQSVGMLSELITAGKLQKQDILDEITVNVTEMFRDPPFWIAMKQIIPELFLNHDTIRIWHAGCSSGEEVYTMAVLLKNAGILEKAKIVASDLDPNVLARAKAGIISMKNMPLNEKNYARVDEKGKLSDHFTIEQENTRLNPDLIKNVSFRIIDLVQTDVFSKFDLILCRNVLIYFDHSLQNKIIGIFHKSLFNYSYLSLGIKENFSWSPLYHHFIPINNDMRIYKKIKE